MPSEPKPWRVLLGPTGAVKILDEAGGLVRTYRDFAALAVAHAQAIRTLRRFQDVYWEVMGHTNPVEVQDTRRPR